MTSPSAAPAASASGTTAVFYPVTYDLTWTLVVVGLAAAVAWGLVSVLRAPLSTRAQLLWLVVIALLPVAGVVAWAVLGRDARHDGRRRRAERDAGPRR